jgi:hypothetical protein
VGLAAAFVAVDIYAHQRIFGALRVDAHSTDVFLALAGQFGFLDIVLAEQGF